MDNSTVNILLVDDRRENLLALEAVLSSSKYHLEKAQSGEEALKWILKKEFAVILMDVQMPGLDGFETARLIQEREKSKDIPIIFITALSQTHENILRGYSVGAIDYLLKPFDPIILQSKVAGFVSLYLRKKKIQKQKEIIKSGKVKLEKAYSQLKRSEAIARAYGETSIDTLVVLNRQNKILSINPAITDMFGYEIGELIGEKISKLLPSFIDQTLFSYPKGKLFESIAIKKDGREFPVDVQLSLAEVEKETLFVFSIRDITNQKSQFAMLEELVKERTNELYESEERYRLLVESSPEGIIVRKLNSQYWSFINKTAMQIFKATTKEQLTENIFLNYIHPDHHQIDLSIIEQVKLGEKVDGVEMKFIRLDGEIIDVEVKCFPFLYEGEQAIHIIFKDITEFKKTREFMQQSEKLTVVGELAAGIAHEIRNPLTSLRGFSQLLQHKLGSENEYVKIMISEIDRINMIVSELLLLAKPSKIDFKQVQIKRLLDEMITLMKAQANLHGVEIQLKLKIPLDNIYIYGIDDKIKQVFINIVKNAIEAMPDGGILIITVYLDHNNVCIDFIDRGIGISDEILLNLGQPFNTSKEKGTGLGLMVCYNIIDSHQGKLKVESEEGKGTRVQVQLPLHFIPILHEVKN